MNTFKAALAFTGYTLAIMAVVILPHVIAYALIPEPPLTRVQAPLLPTVACATEDSVKCFWDASEQGNGLGEDVFN